MSDASARPSVIGTRMSFRTIADHHQPGRRRRPARSSSRTASSACGGTRSPRSPRTSRRSSTTTSSKARTSNGCSAWRSSRWWSPSSRSSATSSGSRSGRPTRATRSRIVRWSAASCCSPAPAHRRSTARSRSTARDCHGDEGQGGTALQLIKSTDPRCDLQQKVDEKLAEEQPYCLPQQVSWAAPNLTLAPLRYTPGAAHADHHLRPTGHADARVGREERQGRAQRTEHPRPRELPVQHQHHPRQGAGGRGRGRRRHAGRPLEKPEVRAAADKWVADTPQLQLAQAALAALPRTTAVPRRSQHRQQRRGAGARENAAGRARVAADHAGRRPTATSSS